jgi:hypothetical protein
MNISLASEYLKSTSDLYLLRLARKSPNKLLKVSTKRIDAPNNDLQVASADTIPSRDLQ